MSSTPQAPRPTINGNNANVDSMLAKLNQRLAAWAKRVGVPPVDGKGDTPPPSSDLLSVTKSHVDGLQAAHNTIDAIEATFGPDNPPSGS